MSVPLIHPTVVMMTIDLLSVESKDPIPSLGRNETLAVSRRCGGVTGDGKGSPSSVSPFGPLGARTEIVRSPHPVVGVVKIDHRFVVQARLGRYPTWG